MRTSRLNAEGYPAVWVYGRTGQECGTPSFSKHPRPAAIPQGGCDVYQRFGTEVDRHLSRINEHACCGAGVLLLCLAAFFVTLFFSPYRLIPVILLFSTIFGSCVLQCWIKSINANADEDVQRVCQSYTDEFRRTTGYVPEYKTKPRYGRTKKGASWTARVFVFRPTVATTTTRTRTRTRTTTAISITTEAVDRLVSMGFEEERVAEALQSCDNDVERAADHLASTPSTMPEAVAVLVSPPSPRAIKRLVDMGFGEDSAIEALEACNNDVERAAESLATTTTTTTAEATHYVTIPPGHSAGQIFVMDVEGRQFNVTCPPGAPPGSRIGVRVS